MKLLEYVQHLEHFSPVSYLGLAFVTQKLNRLSLHCFIIKMI